MLLARVSQVKEQQWNPFFGWESGGEGNTIMIIFQSQHHDIFSQN